MDSIEEGVTYYRGFVYHQETQEERRMRWKEEWAIQEAREYEERCQMNKLIWQ